MKQLRWIFAMLALFLSAGRSQQIVTVNPQEQHQKIDGFGGTLGWDYSNMWWFNGGFQQDAFDRLKWRLFDDMEINIVRLHSEGDYAEGYWSTEYKPKPVITWNALNDNTDPNLIDWNNVWTYAPQDTFLFGLLNYGQNLPASNSSVFLSSWSPPGWLKNPVRVWPQICGGQLNTAYPNANDEFAESWRIMLEIYKGDAHAPTQAAHSPVRVDYISIQNEPNFAPCSPEPNPGTYESAYWNDYSTYHTALTAVMSRLSGWGFPVQGVGPEFGNSAVSLTDPSAIFQNLVIFADNYLSIFATHNYNACNYPRPLDEQTHLQAFYDYLLLNYPTTQPPFKTWQTEFGANQVTFPPATSGCHDEYNFGTYMDAHLEAEHIMVALNDLQASSYQTFWLATYRPTDYPVPVRGDAWVVIDQATHDIETQNYKYWYAKQFTKFIKPNMVRVGLSGVPSTIASAAFESAPNEIQGTGTAVFLNRSNVTVTFDLAWPGMSALDVWRSSKSASDTCSQYPTLIVDGNQRFTISIPDSGIVTVRGTYSRGLPIQLVSFTATYQQPSNSVRLDWRTLTETNNYGFYLEKTTSPPNYQLVPNSFVPGHGTTLEPHNYSFVDQSVSPGLWYYRLKQIDFNGSVHYPGTTTVFVPLIQVVEEDITATGTPFASVPANPVGNGYDINVIKDSIEPPLESHNERSQFWTRGQTSHGYDWIGYDFGAARIFSGLKLQEGVHVGNAGSFTSLSIQVYSGNHWCDVRNLQILPNANRLGQTDNFTVHHLRFTPMAGSRIRIYGRSRGFISVGELRVFSSGLGKAFAGYAGLPDKPTLADNYPNPFNPSTQIDFALPEPGHVKIEIYDLLGQLVRNLVDREEVEGFHSTTWDGRNDRGALVGTGTYLCKMTTATAVATKKMLLLK